MVETSSFLVENFNVQVAYTQSDEINLLWESNEYNENIMFGGRIQKIVSILSSYCSVYFNKKIENSIPELKNKMAFFDCKIWNIPNREEAVNFLIQREQDATKNSVSMAARAYYSHNDILDLKREQMMDLLMAKNINWNDYPDFFKRGTYIQRVHTTRKFSADELEKLPAKHKARTNPDLEVERNEIRVVKMPPLAKVLNKVGVIFNGEEPLSDWKEK